MGRRTSGSCKCGACSNPLSIGIPYSLWSIMADDTPGTGSITDIDWSKAYSDQSIGSWQYLLDDVASINYTDYHGSKGLNGSLLDVLKYGYRPVPNYMTNTSTTKLLVSPPPGSSEETAVDQYLAAGGCVLVSLGNLYTAYSGTAMTTAVNSAIASMNTWLAHIGSSTYVVKDTNMAAELPSGAPAVSSFAYMIPTKAVYALNPDTWLTSGMELSHRIQSVVENRAYADIRRQTGGSVSTPLNSAINNPIPDITTAGSPAYTLSSTNGSLRINAGSLVIGTGVGNRGAYLRTSSKPTILASCPMANMSGSTTGSYRFNNVMATAETLPSGGKLVVYIGHMFENTDGLYDNLGTRILTLLKQKLQAGCSYLTTGLVHLYD